MRVNSGQISFQMAPINYLNPSEQELITLRRRVKQLEHLRTSPDSEYMDVCNKLPRTLIAGYPALYRFDIFRWAYQYDNEEMSTPFTDTVISEGLARELARFHELIKHVENLGCIWDRMIFEYLIRDIQYFHSIFLITDDEKELIKEELSDLLDYLSEVATKGYFPETKKKVSFYISKTNIDTNYSYFYTEKLKICRIHAFDKFDIFTYDTSMVNNFRNWMQLKKRTASLISEVDERSRIEFFKRQRELLKGL